MDLTLPRSLAAVAVLALLWALEGLRPFYAPPPGGLRARLRHDGRNLVLGLLNALLISFPLAALLASVVAGAEARQLGLLRAVDLPPLVAGACAFVLIDLWMYLWHRANHRLPLLWRFHRVHHADARMDASSAFRFHSGEVALSGLARLLVVPLVGADLVHVAVYEAVFLPVILVHHANVTLPPRLDRALAWITVPPAMHRVHHSRRQEETDSNYGSVLSCWDRVFGTFGLRDDARSIHLGLDGFDGDRHQSVLGMLRTPLD
jgi:sterol desaturase/sphingolipid hydroxylase (fatty acid hydroxylase superfamily)